MTGVAVGASSLVVPMYIAEMSPVRIRGGLVILQQLAISGGMLISYLLDFAFDWAGHGAGGPCSRPPYCPPDGTNAGAVLERINPQEKQQELDLLKRNVTESAETSWRELLRPGMRGALIAWWDWPSSSSSSGRIPCCSARRRSSATRA